MTCARPDRLRRHGSDIDTILADFCDGNTASPAARHDEALPVQKASRNGFRRIAREDFDFAMNGESAFFFLSHEPDARVLSQESGMRALTLQPASTVSA